MREIDIEEVTLGACVLLQHQKAVAVLQPLLKRNPDPLVQPFLDLPFWIHSEDGPLRGGHRSRADWVHITAGAGMNESSSARRWEFMCRRRSRLSSTTV